MATIRKQRGRWQAIIRRNGRQASKVFDTKGQARAWAEIEEPIIAAGGVDPGKWTLRRVMDAYLRDVVPQHKGARWEQFRIAKFQRTLEFIDYPVDQVTPEDVTRWAQGMDLAPNSVRREATVLNSIFNYARKTLRVDLASPVRDAILPKESKPRTQRITDAHRDALVLACGYQRWEPPANSYHRVALALLFALETAMRAGEICSVRPENVRGNYVHLTDTKNGDDRDVPLSSPAQQILELVSGNFDIKKASLDALFRRVRARAAEDDATIAEIHFHDSRREAATRLSQKLNVMELARMGGWRDVRVLYQRYYAASAQEIADKLD